VLVRMSAASRGERALVSISVRSQFQEMRMGDE
jgi:hypothetical protein